MLSRVASKVFQPYRVWEVSEGWLSLLSFSWGPFSATSKFRIWECHSSSSERAVVPAPRELLVPTGVEQSLHILLGHTASCLLQPLCVGRQLCLSAVWHLSYRGNKSTENIETASQGKLGDTLQCWGQLLAAPKPTPSLQISNNLCLYSAWFSIRDGWFY